jgi:iron complex outermembrane receptor protein
VGARYTYETKSGFGFNSDPGFVTGPPISGTYSDSWNAFTPKFTATYQATPELMFYGLISRGFQSGGFNVQGSTSAAFGFPYNSEYVWNYEAGEKFDGFDHRLQVNVSGFLDYYTDLQVISFNQVTLSSLTTNAGSAHVDGIEAEARAAPFNWLTMGVEYNHLWATFENYIIDNGPGVPVSNFSGNQVPYVSPDRVTLSGDVHFPVAGGADGTVSISADWSYRAAMWFDAGNTAPAFLRNLTEWRGLLDARAAWTSPNGAWEVELWGKNLTNTVFVTQGAELTFLLESDDPAEFTNPDLHDFFVTPNPPRTFGVTLRRKF